MEKELQKIGHRIKLLRIENKISQKVLAKKLCISQTHLSNIENDRVFKREEKQVWICSNCGRIVVAEKAPEKCPVCDHPQGYFELRSTNY